MGSLEALLKDLNTFQASAEATLLFVSSKLSSTRSPHAPLFPCPLNPHHRVPASALANHTASCQAAKGGFDPKELVPPASGFFYADAPGVVQLHRLPVDQSRPPLPPQPNRPPLPPQSNAPPLPPFSNLPPLPPHPPPGPLDAVPSLGTPREVSSLRVALQQWEEKRSSSLAHQIAAQQEIHNWRDVASPLPLEAGRLFRAVPPDDLAKMVQLRAAEGGVGLTLEEGGALGTLLTWQAQSASGNGELIDKDDRRQRVLTAVALLRPPAGAGPFLLHLWQRLLGGLLRSLPPTVTDTPTVSATEMVAAVETLRDGVRRRQQREYAMRPGLSRAERLAKYDSGVQTAAAGRAQRPAYRPLPDHDWLFRPNDPNQPQGAGGRRNRVELLAELRDLKRRTTSYRAKKQRTPIQGARDLIELRMMQLEEAFGPAHEPAAARAPDSRDSATTRARDSRDFATTRARDSRDYADARARDRHDSADARALDSRGKATGDWKPGSSWGVDTERKRRNEGGPSDGNRPKRGRWDDEDRGRERRDRGKEELDQRGSSRYSDRGAESSGDRSTRYDRRRHEGHDERGRYHDSRGHKDSGHEREKHEEIEEGELPQRWSVDRSREGLSEGNEQRLERRGKSRTWNGREKSREKDAGLEGSFESGGLDGTEGEGGVGRWGDAVDDKWQRDKKQGREKRGFGRPGEWWSDDD